MSHRNRSSCCCDEENVIGTCFSGWGAVPKTPGPGGKCSNANAGGIPGSNNNRFDNWELCAHDNDEEVLLQINRNAWSSVTATGLYGSDPCINCGYCPAQNIGWGGYGEIPIYTWYASHASTKIINEPGSKISDCYDGGGIPDDDQVYTYYHTSYAPNSSAFIDGFGSGRGIFGGMNQYTWPLTPNPNDPGGNYENYFPPGSEMPCCCHSFAGNSSTCDDTWCRRSFFSRCYQQIPDEGGQAVMLSLPFNPVYMTSTPVTRSQFQLIGDARRASRWRTNTWGWIKSADDHFTSCGGENTQFLKRCYHGGDYFWLQDIIQQSRFSETDKFYPHWEASFGSDGSVSVDQKYSFGDCGQGGTDSEAPHYGWPLGKTVIGVFHKEKWWQRYWSSIDENDVCPDDDPNCGTCDGWDPGNPDGQGGCDPNWSPTDKDIYPGHFAACRTPKYVGHACAGVPVFSHEVMMCEALYNNTNVPDIPGSMQGSGSYIISNCAEFVIIACNRDIPIPKRITDIMEAEGILPAPNPNLTETDGEDVAYRIFKKTLKHYAGGDAISEVGRCCINLEGYDYGTIENPGPLPLKGDCGVTSDLRPVGLTCGCDDLVPEPVRGIGCEEWIKPVWDEQRWGGPMPTMPLEDDFDTFDEYNDAFHDWWMDVSDTDQWICQRSQFPSGRGIRQVDGGDCACLGCMTDFIFGLTMDGVRGYASSNAVPWGHECIADLYTFGGTYCFPETICVPDQSEWACRVGYAGQWTPAVEFEGEEFPYAGCTLDPFLNCDQLRPEIGSCCFYDGYDLSPFNATPMHCIETSKEICEDILTTGVVPIGGRVKEEYFPGGSATPACRKLTNQEIEGYPLGVGPEECMGMWSLIARANRVPTPGNAGGGVKSQFRPLGNCDPIEPENLGPGFLDKDGNPVWNSIQAFGSNPDAEYEPELGGVLNFCSSGCNLTKVIACQNEDQRECYPPFFNNLPSPLGYNCGPEFANGIVTPDDNRGDPCRAGFVAEDWYFYGRPGGWSWICTRDLNPINEDRFPQVPRNGTGCGCIDDSTCDPGQTPQCGQPGTQSTCNISPGGGPGCFSAAPFPQETWAQPLRHCCCKCSVCPGGCFDGGAEDDPNSSFYNNFVDSCANDPCGDGDECTIITCIDTPGGGFACSYDCNDENEDCDCDNLCILNTPQGDPVNCTCPPGEQRWDCELGEPWTEGNWDRGGCGNVCETCPPPLLPICGSGCGDLGDDSGGEGCQPGDSGIGSIGVESQNFCSNMQISETCDGAWFKQINTSFKYDSSQPLGLGYDCTYENNAFLVRVKCPDKDESVWDGPACKKYCKEYEISWYFDEAQYPPGEEPEFTIFPLINGVTLDIGQDGFPEIPGGGGSSYYPQFYSDCVHSVFQRDSSNADPRVANCIYFSTAECPPDAEECPPSLSEDVPEDIDPFYRCASSPGHVCTDGVDHGCGDIGCEENDCDLRFGRDMETLVTPNREVFDNLDGNVDMVWVDMVLTTAEHQIRIPCRVILNDKKNPHTDIDGQHDYEWWHYPINEHKPNPSGAFSRAPSNPLPNDCCRCCGSELSSQEGGGIICTRSSGQIIHGMGTEDGSSSPSCRYRQKQSSGAGLPDPACGRVCPEDSYCCPATGQCIEFNSPCVGCPEACPEEEPYCCQRLVGDAYVTSCGALPCEDHNDNVDPPGALNIDVDGDLGCAPDCVFYVNSSVTIIASEE